MSQMLVFRFQAVMRSEIKVAKVMMSHCQEKLLARTILPVPQTDTGSRVENTQVSERTLVKELGFLAAVPVFRKQRLVLWPS